MERINPEWISMDNNLLKKKKNKEKQRRKSGEGERKKRKNIINPEFEDAVKFLKERPIFSRII